MKLVHKIKVVFVVVMMMVVVMDIVSLWGERLTDTTNRN